jgi:hypothetical protein
LHWAAESNENGGAKSEMISIRDAKWRELKLQEEPPIRLNKNFAKS